MPFFSARAKASAMASIDAAKRKLQASLTTLAAPGSSPKRLGDKDDVQYLQKLLEFPDGNVRAAAAWALGWLVGKDDVQALDQLLKHPDDIVRSVAAGAL